MNLKNKTKRLELRLDPELYEYLLNESKKVSALSLSDYVRCILRMGFAMHKKMDEGMENAMKIWASENNKSEAE